MNPTPALIENGIPRIHSATTPPTMANGTFRKINAAARGEDIGATSVALPALSTGAFGFPLAMAAEISVAAARSFAPGAEYVQKIVFCVLDDETYGVFEKALGVEKA